MSYNELKKYGSKIFKDLFSWLADDIYGKNNYSTDHIGVVILKEHRPILKHRACYIAACRKWTYWLGLDKLTGKGLKLFIAKSRELYILKSAEL